MAEIVASALPTLLLGDDAGANGPMAQSAARDSLTNSASIGHLPPRHADVRGDRRPLLDGFMGDFRFVRAVMRGFRQRGSAAVRRSPRSPWWVEIAVFVLFTVVAFAMLFPLPLHVRTHGVDFGWDDIYINTHFMRVFQDWLLGLRPGHR